MTSDMFQAIRLKQSAIDQRLATVPNIHVRGHNGETLLHEAVAHDNADAAEWLIQHGAEVSAQDRNGQTPLHFAAAHSNVAMARLVLDGGADVGVFDAHGNTPLWTAVFNARGKYELVSAILAAGGARVANTKNKAGRSPLDFAKQIGDVLLVKMLS